MAEEVHGRRGLFTSWQPGSKEKDRKRQDLSISFKGVP
jgi:hypothetical protein